jgi:hypothetical protein
MNSVNLKTVIVSTKSQLNDCISPTAAVIILDTILRSVSFFDLKLFLIESL